MNSSWMRELDAFCDDGNDMTIDATLYMSQRRQRAALDDLLAAREALRRHLPADTDLDFVTKAIEEQHAESGKVCARITQWRNEVVYKRSILIRILDKTRKALAHMDTLLEEDTRLTSLMVETPSIPSARKSTA